MDYINDNYIRGYKIGTDMLRHQLAGLKVLTTELEEKLRKREIETARLNLGKKEYEDKQR